MAWNVRQNSDGSVSLIPSGGGSADKDVKIEHSTGLIYTLGPAGLTGTFPTGAEFELGAEVTPGTISYLRLTNSQGEDVYISGNDAQNAVVVAGTKPATP